MTVSLDEVAVAELPWPWHPFKCRWEERFKQLVPHYDDLDDSERARHFGAMIAGLSEQELGQCPYHVADWRLAAELAVIFHRNEKSPAAQGFEREVRKLGGGPAEIEAIRSLWEEPISWTPGSPVVGNGQHRVCALKCAGAEIALVDAS